MGIKRHVWSTFQKTSVPSNEVVTKLSSEIVKEDAIALADASMLSISVGGAPGPRKGQKSTHELLNWTELTFSP
jgi:hypothetical protein